MKAESKATTAHWPRPRPFPWSCPGCGSTFLTADLMPRCPACGFREGGA